VHHRQRWRFADAKRLQVLEFVGTGHQDLVAFFPLGELQANKIRLEDIIIFEIISFQLFHLLLVHLQKIN